LSPRHEIRQYSQARVLWPLRNHKLREEALAPSYTYLVEANLLNGLAAALGRRRWYGNIFMGLDLPVFRPAALARLLRWADMVMVECPWQFAYCRRRRPSMPVVLAAHNVEFLTRLSHAEAAGVKTHPGSPVIRWVRRVEANAVRRADLVVAVSEPDHRAFMDCYGVPSERIVVVANGTDTRRFVPAPPSRRMALRQRLGLPDGPLGVFMAAHPKAPDIAALRWIRLLARRMPGCSFVVTGGILRPAVERNLIATGWVEDVVPYLQAADFALCPVAHGGGTKLKLFDSLSAGLPVVAFPEALEGTSLAADKHLLVSDHSEIGLKAAVCRVLEDWCLSARLGEAGRAFVEQHHDWRILAGKLEEALNDLVRRKEAASGSSTLPALEQPHPAA